VLAAAAVDLIAPLLRVTRVAPERMRVKTQCTWRMKPSPSKTVKAASGKKRGHEEAAGSSRT
jgi:hypothetical protein